MHISSETCWQRNSPINVNKEAQIRPLHCWLVTFPWNPFTFRIKSKYFSIICRPLWSSSASSHAMVSLPLLLPQTVSNTDSSFQKIIFHRNIFCFLWLAVSRLQHYLLFCLFSKSYLQCNCLRKAFAAQPSKVKCTLCTFSQLLALLLWRQL